MDAVVTGEAEETWPRLVRDLQSKSLEQVYRGSPASMLELPMPRYDLLERAFMVPRVMQATRGCPFSCSFCTVPSFNPGFRVRPIDDVLRDIEESRFLFWWQNKVASRVLTTKTCAVSGNTRITPENIRMRFQDCMIAGSA